MLNDNHNNNNNNNDEIATVNCTTSKGIIGIELYQSWSPIGYEHIKTLFEIGYYNNNQFYRIVPHSLIQFGISYNHNHNNIEAILDDPFHIPPIPFTPGTISFAGNGIHSRTTQLFIALEADNDFGTESWETPIGRITSGIENIYKFYNNYGDISPWGNGPNQDKIYEDGLSYIEKNFPKLDYIIQCTIHNNNNHKRRQRNNNHNNHNIVASSINRHNNNKQRALNHHDVRESKERTTQTNNKRSENNNIHKIKGEQNENIIDEDHHAKLRKANHHDNNHHHLNEHVHQNNNYDRFDHHHNNKQHQQHDHIDEQHEHQRHHIHLHDALHHDGEQQHLTGHINHDITIVGVTAFSWELLSICILLFSAVLGLWLTFVFGSSSTSSSSYGFYKKKIRKTQ